jgi:hypothetical protein
VRAELGQDVLHVVAHRDEADVQLAGHALGRRPSCQAAEHLALAPGQVRRGAAGIVRAAGQDALEVGLGSLGTADVRRAVQEPGAAARRQVERDHDELQPALVPAAGDPHRDGRQRGAVLGSCDERAAFAAVGTARVVGALDDLVARASEDFPAVAAEELQGTVVDVRDEPIGSGDPHAGPDAIDPRRQLERGWGRRCRRAGSGR